MSEAFTPIADYDRSPFAATCDGGTRIEHDIYTRGDGPPVVIIQELPGIGPETLRLADEFAARGFSVALPHLFGPLEKISMVGNLVRVLCMRREFALFEANRSSPVVDWLKALCREMKTRRQVRGVGVIGMCLTGNFALSLLADDSVLAAVASQPSMPLMKASALHMSSDDIALIRRRIEQTAPAHAYRFAGDPMCNADKFQAIDAAFNDDGVVRMVNHVLPGKGHSVLTLDFADERGHPTRQALDDILAYFTAQLL